MASLAWTQTRSMLESGLDTICTSQNRYDDDKTGRGAKELRAQKATWTPALLHKSRTTLFEVLGLRCIPRVSAFSDIRARRMLRVFRYVPPT